MLTTAPNTIVDVLDRHASQHPDALVYRFLLTGEVDGPKQEWSYGFLRQRAWAIGAELRKRLVPGDTALLLHPTGLEFVASFFGCLMAGVVAVPAYLPDRHRLRVGLARLAATARVAQPKLVLSVQEAVSQLAAESSALGAAFGEIPVLGTDELIDVSGPLDPFPSTAQDVAYLQFTSGSTSTPRGVRVTHGNLIANQRSIQHAVGSTSESAGCSWLPMFHDMGLVGSTLHPLFLGTEATLMSPMSFMLRPMRWLQAMSRWGAVMTPAPDFGYQLCTQRASSVDLRSLDLSRWRIAFNGAEPIRARTLAEFTRVFAPCGFQATTFCPTYGLAEATLMVSIYMSDTVPALDASPAVQAGGPAQRVINCGRPGPWDEVLIVHPDRHAPLEEGEVGEIWVRGPSVAAGYHEDPEASRRVFGAMLPSGKGPFLRTGDLGFIRGGDLFVTGRLKELIIVAGRNIHPHDIEQIAERAEPRIRPRRAAAFAVDAGEQEGIVVLVETTQRSDTDRREIRANVELAVTRELGVNLYDVVVVPPRKLPLTSSGKLQRQACHQLYLSELSSGGHGGGVAGDGAGRPGLALASLRELVDPANPVASIEDILLTEIARLLKRAKSSIDVNASLMDQGLVSAAQAALSARLESGLGVKLTAAVVYNQPSIRDLARYLAPQIHPPAAANDEPEPEEDAR